jgi:hypothetical protein
VGIAVLALYAGAVLRVHAAGSEQSMAGPAAGPFAPLADPVHLPMLAGPAGGRCSVSITAQNLSAEPTKAALLVWGTETACPGAGGPCAAPIRLLCSGLISPGSAWVFGRSDLGPGAVSGIVYSFSLRQLSALGSDITPDQPAADYLCGVLRAAVVDDCENYRRFKVAYDTGASFGRVRLALAYGGALAVDVARECPGEEIGAPGRFSHYEGVAGKALGGRDGAFDWSSYYAAALEEDPANDRHGSLYLQNGGELCAKVEVWMIEPDGGCGRIRLCRTVLLAPGSAMAVGTAGCLKPGTRASAWLRSSQPLAAAVEISEPAAALSHVAVPAELQPPTGQPPIFTAGSTLVHGPLPPDSAAAAETRVYVQNLSGVTMGHVQVRSFTADGLAGGWAEEAWLCPRGSRMFTVPAWREPDNPPTAVRVASLPWQDVDGATVPAANVTAVITQRRANGLDQVGTPGARTRESWLSYNLAAEPRAGDWRIGRGEAGTRLVAVPSFVRNAEVSTRLVVANTVPQPGVTHAALLTFDVNGPVGVHCLSLSAGSTVVADADDLGLPGPAFRGSAVISAAAWRHPVFDSRGRQSANLVGLAVLALSRAQPGAEGAGDNLAAEAGRPFEQDGPVNPFAALRPDCPPLPGVESGEKFGRAFLPWVGTVAPPTER